MSNLKNLLLIPCGRKVPKALCEHLEENDFNLSIQEPKDDQCLQKLEQATVIVLMLPAWNGKEFLAPLALWYNFLHKNHKNTKLLFASFQKLDHPNHIDLLKLKEYKKTKYEQALSSDELGLCLPHFEGTDINYKLERFFAGHGQDSVIAVLMRIRMLVQMASTELLSFNTAYDEVFDELLAAVRLDLKWQEWQNRWLHYYPLFEFTPFALAMDSIAQHAERINEWMLAGGKDETLIKNGLVLEVLNAISTELKTIEEQYVIQKLSHLSR